MADGNGRIIGSLESDVRNLRSSVQELTEQVRGLRDDFHHRKGMLKMLGIIYGFIGLGAGLVGSYIKGLIS